MVGVHPQLSCCAVAACSGPALTPVPLLLLCCSTRAPCHPQRSNADEFRVFCLQHQYNRNVTYNDDRLRDAAAFLTRVRDFVAAVDAHVVAVRVAEARATGGVGDDDQRRPLSTREPASLQASDEALRSALRRAKAAVRGALATDFDTAACVAALTELVREGYKALDAGARSDVLQVRCAVAVAGADRRAWAVADAHAWHGNGRGAPRRRRRSLWPARCVCLGCRTPGRVAPVVVVVVVVVAAVAAQQTL